MIGSTRKGNKSTFPKLNWKKPVFFAKFIKGIKLSNKTYP